MLWQFRALTGLPDQLATKSLLPAHTQDEKTLLASCWPWRWSSRCGPMPTCLLCLIWAMCPIALSMADEARLGRDFMRAMRDAGDVLDDAEVNDYINTLGHRLSASVRIPGLQLTYFVVNDKQINAFAMPGGYVGVNSGLVVATQSEGELASVVGHETAHVTQRHIARMQAESSATSPLLLLGTVLAAVLASRAGGSQASIGTLSAGLGLQISNQLAFSRDFEREADRVGMQYLAQAGFDVRTMPAFFQRLEAANRYSDNNAYAFLRTHPVTSQRISEAQNRALEYPVKMRADSTAYLLVREKLRVMTLAPDDAVRYYQTMLDKGQYLNEGAMWYGMSRAQLASHHLPAARTALGKAEAACQPTPCYLGSRPRLHVRPVIGRGTGQPAAWAAVLQGQPALANGRAGCPYRQRQSSWLRWPCCGSCKAAIRAMRRCIAVKPVVCGPGPQHYHAALGNAFYFERRYEAALEQYQFASQAKGDDFYCVLRSRRACAKLKNC
jgi:predicted Zn-dependent protease